MKTDVTAVRDLLAGTDPAPSRQQLSGDPREQEAMAATLRTILTSENVDQPVQPNSAGPQPPNHRGPRVLAAAAGLVAIATVGAVALPAALKSSDTSARAATPPLLHYTKRGGQPAVTVLSRLADLAAQQPVNAYAGRYVYRKTTGWYLNTRVTDKGATSAIIPTVRETWIAADGSGQVTEGSGVPLAASDGTPDQETRASTAQIRGHKHTTVYGSGQLAVTDQHQLSTKARELRRQLTSNNEIPDDVELLLGVADLTRQQQLTPALAAAADRALAETASLRDDGIVTDRAGRRAIAIALDSTYSGLATTYQLLLDPKTGAVMGDEQILREPGKLNVATPAVISYTSYLVGGAVATLGRPGAQLPQPLNS